MVHKSDYVTANGVPIVNPANIVNGTISSKNIMYISKDKSIELERYKLEVNDIVLARRGDLTKCTIVGNEQVDFICGTGSFFLHLISVLPQYFQLVYMSSYVQIILTTECVGATMNNLNQSVLSQILFPLPPLAEQKRVVARTKYMLSIITTLDNEQYSLHTTIKQAKAKVLDLAIHGKLVSQDPNDEPASELLKRINPKAEIITDNGHYQKLPVGWCLTKVKDAFIINPKNKENDDIEAGFVPMANISDGFTNHFSFETKKWETIKSGFTHFSDGDIAVAKISPCLENRKSMVLSNLPNGIGAGTTELHVFRPLCVTQLYGLYFFKSNYFINKCIGTFNGVVGQQRVGKNIVECIDFPLPPLAEQQRIVVKIEEIFQQLDMIETAL